MRYLVFHVRGGRIGSVSYTAEAITEANRQMVLSLIQQDITGTIHYDVLGIRKS